MTEPEQPTDGVRRLANDWYERSATVAVGHYKTAELLARRHRLLSVWSAVLSALVGTAVFGTVQAQPDLWIKVIVGFVSVIAAVLATLAASMGYQDRAEKHRVAGSKYNAVGRALEQLRAATAIDPSQLSAVRDRLDALAAEMPHIPRKVHDELGHFPDIGKGVGRVFYRRFSAVPRVRTGPPVPRPYQSHGHKMLFNVHTRSFAAPGCSWRRTVS